MQNRAANRKYHYIYKITRDDGKYYIGLHSTDDLDDGYFGSGKRVTRSIKMHGKDRHVKEILEFLPCRETLKAREQEIVCAELLKDEQCMNLTLGGGGDVHNQSTPEVISRKIKEAWQDPEKRANMTRGSQTTWTSDRKARQSELKKKQHENPEVIDNISKATKAALSRPEVVQNMKNAANANWANPEYRAEKLEQFKRSHDADSYRQKQSAAKSGSNNPNFGTKWVYNESLRESKRIPKNESIPEGWKLGRKIYKEQ